MKRILGGILLLAIFTLAGCRKEERPDIKLFREELDKINSYSNFDLSYTIKADDQITAEGQQIVKGEGDTQEMMIYKSTGMMVMPYRKYYTNGYMCYQTPGLSYKVIKMPFPGIKDDNPLRTQIDFNQYDYEFTIRDEPGRKIYTVLTNDTAVMPLVQEVSGKKYPPNIYHPTTIVMKVELVINKENGILKTFRISATVTRGDIVQTMEMLARVNAVGEAVNLVIPFEVILAIEKSSESGTK